MESHAYADVRRPVEAGSRGERVGRGDGGAEQGHIVRHRFARDLIGVSHAVEVTVHIERRQRCSKPGVSVLAFEAAISTPGASG